MAGAAFAVVACVVAVTACTADSSSDLPPFARDKPLTPSPAPSPLPEPPTGDPRTVRVAPGDDLQAAVNDAPPTSVFVLGAGVHREQQVVPRDGDRFVGEPGAIMNGSRLLAPEDFVADGGRWYVDGQTQEGLSRGRPRDGKPQAIRDPEEVFVDGDRRLDAVDRLADIGPGRSFFDEDADRLWLGDDPASFDSIETATTAFAFGGTGVRDVVIENLIVEKYASPVQFGAIGGSLGFEHPYDWTVRHVEVRLNHGGGIGIGPGMTIENVDVHHNGQIGIIGHGADMTTEDGYTALVTIRDSRIHHNNELGFQDKHEAGTSKFKECRAGFVFENNWVHDNDGSGPWWDIDNVGAEIRRNRIEDNVGAGIFYEISQGPVTIEDNVILRNGTDEDRLDPGVFVSNANGVTVRNNTIAGGPFGVVILSRGSRDPASTQIEVSGNDIAFRGGWSGVLVEEDAPGPILETVVFRANRWWVESGSRPFRWGGDRLSEEAWAPTSGETGGEIRSLSAGDGPDLTPTSRGWTESVYGPSDDVELP